MTTFHLRTTAKRWLARTLFGNDHWSPSFSTAGEDRIIDFLVGFKGRGLFVDVGAYHPTEASNTFLFYLRGWRGINIDARPGSMDLFNKFRPEDINLELAISSHEGVVRYRVINGQSSMNSCSADFINRMQVNVCAEIEMRAVPLAEVLDRHLSANKAIDFFSIDVEGLEASVLRSNDWKRFRPHIVLCEDFSALSRVLIDSELVALMQNVGYTILAKTTNSIFFVDDNCTLSNVGQLAVQ